MKFNERTLLGNRDQTKFISLSTVRSWIHQGRLPAIKLGRRIMVRKVVIDEILKYGLEAVEKPFEPRSLKGETWSFEVFDNAKD